MKSSLLVFLFLVQPALGYGVAISPNILHFDKAEASLYLFNPNSQILNYEVQGCEHVFLELHRSGTIDPNARKEALIRYNPAQNEGIEECSLDIFFKNNAYSAGFSVQLTFPLITFPALHDEKTNYIVMAVVGVLFLVGIALIVKYA